jgi:GAF domain-containing protein
MFELPTSTAHEEEHRRNVLRSIEHMTAGEHDLIANCANVASVLYHSLDAVNWAGFYLFDGTELVLGPFHGKPACIRISIGRGVCGTSAAEKRTVVVPDVEVFPERSGGADDPRRSARGCAGR